MGTISYFTYNYCTSALKTKPVMNGIDNVEFNLPIDHNLDI